MPPEPPVEMQPVPYAADIRKQDEQKIVIIAIRLSFGNVVELAWNFWVASLAISFLVGIVGAIIFFVIRLLIQIHH